MWRTCGSTVAVLSQPFRDAAVGEPLRHEREHLALMLGQLVQRIARARASEPRRDDLRVHDHLGGGDPVQWVDDLGRVRHTVLSR
jgi:hypothetical protein